MVKEIKHVCWQFTDGSNVPPTVYIQKKGRVKLDGETQKKNMEVLLRNGTLLTTKYRSGEMNQSLIGAGFVTKG